ncbi:MAG TPA: DUF3006 domain-containing protein [Clostridia bacterium]|nr:DUF3006 domain-containing protein [Clostridia bacterium]
MLFNNNNDLIESKINLVNQLTEQKKQNEISKFINQLSERIKNMESKYVVDKIEGNYAVCENRETGEIFDLELSNLPKEIKEGTVLKLHNNKYLIDSESKTEIENRIKQKMNKLWEN